jgi:hypothetical protein
MRRAVSKAGDPENGCRAGVRPCPTAKAKRKQIQIRSNRDSGAKKTSTKRDPDNRDGLREEAAQIPIRATLVGSNRCEALGATGRGYTPILALCRALVAAGHDPRRPLHAYRGDVLTLVVRSIGDGARLRVATHGVGFESSPGCTGGPPVRQSGPTILRGGSKGERSCGATAKRQKLRASKPRRRR